MFIKPKTETELDKTIRKAYQKLNDQDVMSDEYKKVLDYVVQLEKLKDASQKRSLQISPDTMVLALTNLVGIAMIIRHENLNVITSKATGFIQKLK